MELAIHSNALYVIKWVWFTRVVGRPASLWVCVQREFVFLVIAYNTKELVACHNNTGIIYNDVYNMHGYSNVTQASTSSSLLSCIATSQECASCSWYVIAVAVTHRGLRQLVGYPFQHSLPQYGTLHAVRARGHLGTAGGITVHIIHLNYKTLQLTMIADN